MKEIVFDYLNEVIKVSCDSIDAIGSPQSIAFVIHSEKKQIGIVASTSGFMNARDSLEIGDPVGGYYIVQCPVFLNALHRLMGWDDGMIYSTADVLHHEGRLLIFNLQTAISTNDGEIDKTNRTLRASRILYNKRKQMGKTLKEIADRAGIPFQNYQRFECGGRDILNASYSLTCRILNALELAPDALYGEVNFKV